MYVVTKTNRRVKTWLNTKHFKEERERLGYNTQEEFAHAFGATQQLVSKWETGWSDPRADQLVKLAKFFGVTIDYLLGLSPEREGRVIELTEEQVKELLFRYLTPDNAPEILERVTLVLKGKN